MPSVAKGQTLENVQVQTPGRPADAWPGTNPSVGSSQQVGHVRRQDLPQVIQGPDVNVPSHDFQH